MRDSRSATAAAVVAVEAAAAAVEAAAVAAAVRSSYAPTVPAAAEPRHHRCRRRYLTVRVKGGDRCRGDRTSSAHARSS